MWQCWVTRKVAIRQRKRSGSGQHRESVPASLPPLRRLQLRHEERPHGCQTRDARYDGG